MPAMKIFRTPGALACITMVISVSLPCHRMKKFIQIAFLLIGGALGLVFLPPLYELLHLSSNPWLDNPYVSVALGALLLFTLSFAFSDYFVRLISWMEEVLFKVPVGDLLFGTLGLIIGLIVAYFL